MIVELIDPRPYMRMRACVRVHSYETQEVERRRVCTGTLWAWVGVSGFERIRSKMTRDCDALPVRVRPGHGDQLSVRQRRRGGSVPRVSS